jgi:hypothetical protein
MYSTPDLLRALTFTVDATAPGGGVFSMPYGWLPGSSQSRMVRFDNRAKAGAA